MSMLGKLGSRLRRLRMTALRASTFHSPSDLPGCSLQPTVLIDNLLDAIKPDTALDAGGGTGKALDYLLAKEVDKI